VRIAIVNDLAPMNELLRAVVSLNPDHQVIWMAENGAAALKLCAENPPDLILMDLIMPGMDGVETTRRIMAATPCAILVVTASVRDHVALVFEAIGHGALDAVDVPWTGPGDRRGAAEPLMSKIDIVARLIGKFGNRIRVDDRPRAAPDRRSQLVAIGSSTGGPAVLAAILRQLPTDFPAAVVIVQHLEERFAQQMAEWLGRDADLPVRVAKEGDRLEVGAVLLAGTGDHLTLKAAQRLGYTAEPIQYVYRPSVDVFFESVSRLWRGDAIGVLLTGMGRDGALGLKSLRNRGHYTIAQDEATSAVYGMPRAAQKLDAAVDVLPAEHIGAKLVDLLMSRSVR
jgi:two-component system response regulator WspF